MTSKPSEHDDETTAAALRQIGLDALFERLFPGIIIRWETAVKPSTVAPQAVEFTYLLNSIPPSDVKQLYAADDNATAQGDEKMQKAFLSDLQRYVEERQNVHHALEHVEQLVADMRHDQGEIDVLKTDTRRILTKLRSE